MKNENRYMIRFTIMKICAYFKCDRPFRFVAHPHKDTTVALQFIGVLGFQGLRAPDIVSILCIQFSFMYIIVYAIWSRNKAYRCVTDLFSPRNIIRKLHVYRFFLSFQHFILSVQLFAVKIGFLLLQITKTTIRR